MTERTKQVIKTINDRTYVINSFRGEKGWEFLPRLSKYIFPFIGFLGGEELTDEQAGESLSRLLEGENSREISILIKELVSDVEVGGMKINFNEEFSENYDALLILALEVIKLNYAKSFQRLVTNFNNVLA
ncbi:hypothetical protein BS46_gp33 [Acinetobacter phage BS46]|nr:hypothetical protein BS46_gp33 [Acinetobacter phage BS46]